MRHLSKTGSDLGRMLDGASGPQGAVGNSSSADLAGSASRPAASPAQGLESDKRTFDELIVAVGHKAAVGDRTTPPSPDEDRGVVEEIRQIDEAVRILARRYQTRDQPQTPQDVQTRDRPQTPQDVQTRDRPPTPQVAQDAGLREHVAMLGRDIAELVRVGLQIEELERERERERERESNETKLRSISALTNTVKKHWWKTASYMSAALASSASASGWAVYSADGKDKHTGQTIQQAGQALGNLFQNGLGAAGDYYELREKELKDEDARGIKLKITGQVTSMIAAGVTTFSVFGVAPSALGPTGAGLNAVGLALTGRGEWTRGNRVKAIGNWIGAAVNGLAMVGGIVDAATAEHVGKVISEALLDMGSDNNAWTSAGGAWDDARRSHVEGSRSRKLRDPKVGGQSLTAVGATLNLIALALAARVQRALAGGDKSSAEAAHREQLTAVVCGAIGAALSAGGNALTGYGEGFEAEPRADAESGFPLEAVRGGAAAP